MEKIIKKADIYLKIDNDDICYTVDISGFSNNTETIYSIAEKINQMIKGRDVESIKLESIYFREEKINAKN